MKIKSSDQKFAMLASEAADRLFGKPPKRKRIPVNLQIPVHLEVDEELFTAIIRKMVNTPPLSMKHVPKKRKK